MTGQIVSARLTGKKKATNVHLVADDAEFLESIPRENEPWIDSMYVHPYNTTTYSSKANS